MSIESGKRYYIMNKRSRTVVDLDIRNNKTVQCWTRHEGANQQVRVILFTCTLILSRLQWDLTEVQNGWQIRNALQRTYLSFEGDPHDEQKIVCTSAPYVWHIWRDDKDPTAYRSANRIKMLPVLVLILVPGSVSQTIRKISTLLTTAIVLLSSCGLVGRVTIKSGVLNKVSKRATIEFDLHALHSQLKMEFLVRAEYVLNL